MNELELPRWTLIMNYIYNNRDKSLSITNISINTQTTYSHTLKVLQLLLDKKLLKFDEEDKRTKKILLTNKGVEVSKLIIDLENKMM